MKKYAKNPAELTETVIDNPEEKSTGKPRKNPQRVIAGYKGQNKRLRNKVESLEKKLSKQNNEDTMSSSRKNPEEVIETGREMVIQNLLAVGGAFGAGKVVNYATNKYGDQMSEGMKKLISIGLPIVSGTVLAAYGGKSQLAQQAGNGMVLAGVSTGVKDIFETVLPEENEDLSDTFGYNYNNSLGDVNVSPSDVLVKSDTGNIVNAQTGRVVGNIYDQMGTKQIEAPSSNASSEMSAQTPQSTSMDFEQTENYAA